MGNCWRSPMTITEFRLSTAAFSFFPPVKLTDLLRNHLSSTEEKAAGFGLALEAGLLIGSQNSEIDAPFSFNILVNYTAGTKNILGFGSGVEFLGSAFSPFFLEYKRLFNDRKATPFVFFRGGALFIQGVTMKVILTTSIITPRITREELHWE